ncbi:uncharacterized protein LOC115881307 [Sitophilus oryzae]|uniref:Uncharacterized protein LOC115881307 n=1 Tax=Sitophilus oryzae TaxID=7048 RepID=A0A6J2XUZ9_SITOR|nr:uncharacterized protein LOC115881307 [Sitophilus oryzae]
MNPKKTKFMILTKREDVQANVLIDDTPMERVQQYKYQGSWLTENLDQSAEIKARIEGARAAFVKLKKLDKRKYEFKIYLSLPARLHYGLTKTEVRTLAYQYAIANNKPHPSSWDQNKIAGKEWLRQYLRRHGDLSLRKPESTSLARSTSFNAANVASFFRNYKKGLSRGNFTPENLEFVTRQGLTTVHVPPKIIGPKGIKQLGQITSGERGQNVTLIASINAIGNHLPPMMIFPRVNFKPHMLKGCPVGTIGGANPSGWSNESLFLEFLHLFKSCQPLLKIRLYYHG